MSTQTPTTIVDKDTGKQYYVIKKFNVDEKDICVGCDIYKSAVKECPDNFFDLCCSDLNIIFKESPFD